MKSHDIIKNRRKELKISQATLGDKVGYSQQTIQKIENGERKLDEDKIKSFSKALNLTIQELLGDDIKPIVPIYKVGYVQAGKWNDACQLPQDEWEEIYFPVNDNYKNKKIFALGVKGDSMNKLFEPEKTTLICCSIEDYDNEILNGQIIIAYRYSPDGKCEATVKKFMRTDDNTIVLIAETTNPLISNIVIHPDNNEYKIAAVVIADMRIY